MLIGYNHDVSYKDQVFHLQTEDRGREVAQIESHIFLMGQILDSLTMSYRDWLTRCDGPVCEVRIRAMMQTSHKHLYRRLVSGAYDAQLAAGDEAPATRAPESDAEARRVYGWDAI